MGSSLSGHISNLRERGSRRGGGFYSVSTGLADEFLLSAVKKVLTMIDPP